jgi:CRISPR-associated protein Csd1
MILQALVKRYEDAGDMPPPGWQTRPADFAINLDENGNVLDIISLAEYDGKKKMRKMLSLPEEPSGRTSGIKAAFLCDNDGYIFGTDEKRGKEKFAASATLHGEVLGDVHTQTAESILKFFEFYGKQDVLTEKAKSVVDVLKKTDPRNFVFMTNGKFTHEEDSIKEAWNEYRNSSEAGESARCLVSGELDTVTTLHGKINLKNLPKGPVPLISSNRESFSSYGKTAEDPAAQIGEKAAFAYVTALNNLLKSKKHHQSVGKDTIVYWAEGKGELEAETFSWTLQPTENDTEKLSSVMNTVSQGKMIDVEGCDFARKFYLLGLSPNPGRISVRFFVTDSFGEIISNIIEHYQNMEIAAPKNDKFHYLPPWILLSETTVSKKSGDAAPLLSGQLLNNIVTGARYPQTLYNAILIRAKANEPINKTKAAIIKAVLIRNYQESEVTTVSLNPDSNNKPYVLGRLFSVLEQLQNRASGGSLNATIRDRYFSSACANPGSVFSTLLMLSMRHSSKLDNAVFYEKLKTDLLGRLDGETPFPSALSLDDQGRFILGYYHQTQDFYTSKKEKENKEENGNV